VTQTPSLGVGYRGRNGGGGGGVMRVQVCCCSPCCISGVYSGSHPTGNLRLMVQSSAIRAAILEEGKEEPEDGDKPLTREEMVARAAAHAAKHSSEAVKVASLAAARAMASVATSL
jgi:hypothetical protein